MKKILGFGLALMVVAGFSSCKPKQSAYKSVYQAAKEREMQQAKTTTNTRTATPVTTLQAPVRTEKVTAVDANDAGNLKAFSVVVASLSVKPNADALKGKLEEDGMKVILAQNEKGMYRVIVGSFDDRESADAQRASIMQRYSTAADVATLKKVYGIIFDDLWILKRAY